MGRASSSGGICESEEGIQSACMSAHAISIKSEAHAQRVACLVVKVQWFFVTCSKFANRSFWRHSFDFETLPTPPPPPNARLEGFSGQFVFFRISWRVVGLLVCPENYDNSSDLRSEEAHEPVCDS